MYLLSKHLDATLSKHLYWHLRLRKSMVQHLPPWTSGLAGETPCGRYDYAPFQCVAVRQSVPGSRVWGFQHPASHGGRSSHQTKWPPRESSKGGAWCLCVCVSVSAGEEKNCVSPQVRGHAHKHRTRWRISKQMGRFI